MIFSILMMLIVILSVACVLFFIFYLLLPSLNAQKVNTSNPLFSKDEFFTRHSVPAGVKAAKRAVILCSEKKNPEASNGNYNGFSDCLFYVSQFDVPGDCKHGCIGLGSCAKVCSRNAISLVNGTAVVNAYCDGCGDCLDVCPRKLITLVDYDSELKVSCNAYTLFNGSYEEKCPEFDKGLELSSSSIYKPKSYAFWKGLYGVFHKE